MKRASIVGNVGILQGKNQHKMAEIEWTNRFAPSINGTPGTTVVKMRELTDNITKTCCAKFGMDILQDTCATPFQSCNIIITEVL
jgi:hypothetical protein